jgi:hypothetical protein
VSPFCPRCGGDVRQPGLASSAWRCTTCGPIAPVHLAKHLGPDVMHALAERIAAGGNGIPLWCPWPLPAGFTVTGVGWAGDDYGGVQATAVACTGPAPLLGGPADIVLVAEDPGVGLGNRLAGLVGSNPDVLPAGHTAQARVKAAGRDTPMWTVGDAVDRVAYVGEARGRWLYAIAWPPDAGYVLSEHIVLHDLSDWMPAELVYGAPSPYLNGRI